MTFVLENFISFLRNEVQLLRGVERQVDSLRELLYSINVFLQSGENHDGRENEGRFIERIREAAREAEGVIDKYIVHVIKQSRRNRAVKLLHLLDVRNVPNTIASINESLDETFNHRYRFPAGGQQQSSNSMMQPLSGSELAAERDDGVGFGDHINKVVDMLTDEKIKKRHVVSITGMGGSGKTKLAINIFYAVKRRFKSRFASMIFVSGSRKYKAENWLEQTLKELGDEYIYDDTQQQLRKTLRKRLQGRKYLVVMDGMWNNGVWDIAKKAFPDDNNGSRILITSREKVVASKDEYEFPPYQIPLLDEAESWQLLKNRVFGGSSPSSSEIELTHIVQQLAKNCNGLPLSIVELGNLLKTRTLSAEKWKSDIDYIQEKNEEKCLVILSESYKHLPSHLKVCFLYLGLFPKDFEIFARQLVQMWSAEGFIRAKGRDAVKVAEEYLQELIDRNLIRVASRRSDGEPKTCCVHDLIRKLSKSESKKEKFLEVHDSGNYETSAKLPRTLSIQGNACQYISSYGNHRSPSPRSLLVFGQCTFNLKHWQIIYKIFKYTRLLYFWDVSVQLIPKEIEKLIFLTYLRIGSDSEDLKIPALPASICNLPYLETIDIKGQIKETLPERIWRMKQLRHLKVSKGMRLPDPIYPSSTTSKSGPSSNYNSMNLRILYGLLVHKNTKFLMGQFPNVEKLHLLHDEKKPLELESEVTELFASFESFGYLRGLKIVNFPKSSYASNLFPSALQKITIVSSYLDSENFRILGDLDQLRFLKIRRTHDKFTASIKLICRPGSFSNLQVLQLIELNITKWKMDRTAMPKLRRLVISKCYQLLCLPVELLSLPNLDSQNVEVSDMSEYFTK